MKRSGLSRTIVAIAMMLIGWLPSLAHDFEVDGVFYTKTSDNTVAVTYKGDSYSQYNEYYGNVVIPEVVNHEGIAYSVTRIGYGAFSDCTSLTGIEIPNSVTSIGSYAFRGCASLTEITCLATTPPAIESNTFKNFAGHTTAISCNPAQDYSFTISWQEFSRVLSGMNFKDIDEFQGVYNAEDISVVYKFNGKDITNHVPVMADTELSAEKSYAWSFTFYDNISPEYFPLNIDDVTKLDIEVICTPNYLKEDTYPVLTIATSLTIKPLREYLSKMVPRMDQYWFDDNTLRVLPYQYGSLAAGETCDYRFPLQQAFLTYNSQSVVYNNELSCVTWDVVFSDAQSAGYVAKDYDLYYNGVKGASLEWEAGGDDHVRFDELCNQVDNHQVYVTVYNNAAGKEIIDANQPVQITFLARYPNGQVVPVESYNLQFVKPLNFSTAEFNGYFIDGALEGQNGYAINTADQFIIKDFRDKEVKKNGTNGLYEYYGVKDYQWHVDQARIGITAVGVIASKDKVAYTITEGREKGMVRANEQYTMLLSDVTNADLAVKVEGDYLIYENAGGLPTEKEYYLVVPVTVEHKWGKAETAVVIPVEPPIIKWGKAETAVVIPVEPGKIVNKISLDSSELLLKVSQTATLTATVLPETASNKSVTWKSSNESVATVDANGKVTSIGDWAFSTCTSLTSIEIGNSVSSIEDYAFLCCDSLTESTCLALTPPTIESGTFTNYNADLYVPIGCKAAYEAAEYWKDFSNIIEISSSSNYLSSKTINTYSGASERVSVEMTNEQAITAFQCDIYLPDGISVATIDGEYDINLSSRAKSSHSLSCVEQSDGSIRLLCYSMSLATFSGNEGELFDINFNISKEIEGNYQVLINNVVLTDKAQNEYKSSTTIDFNVKAYVPADVNNDGSINVTDVVATASYILGLDTKKFIFEAADMNKDGVINVTDIVGIASVILNGGSASNVSVQRCAPNSSDVIKIEDFAAGKNQSQQVAIEMTNASDYSACQMDIRLPKGMSIAGCELASATTDHMVAYRELPDGAVRVLVYSLTCRTLPNSEEGIIRLRTTTDNRFEGGEIVVENILFADRGQNEYRLYDSVANVNLATGVSATDMDCVVYAENRSIVIISPCDQQATITSVDGVSRTYTLNEGLNEIATPQAGVYIVTLADRTFKVMVK